MYRAPANNRASRKLKIGVLNEGSHGTESPWEGLWITFAGDGLDSVRGPNQNTLKRVVKQ